MPQGSGGDSINIEEFNLPLTPDQRTCETTLNKVMVTIIAGETIVYRATKTDLGSRDIITTTQKNDRSAENNGG